MPHDARRIEMNVRAHDRVSGVYEWIHGEIYNPREQERLATELKSAVRRIACGEAKPLALDFGCGAGNLTAHLLKAGCEVIASDVSPRFLELVRRRYGVQTFPLNGTDLSGMANESVDIIATYSVLHHVPDYLTILDEFERVLRRGGILYIDHETSMNIWHGDANYMEFERVMRKRRSTDWWKYLNPYSYFDHLIRAIVNPRYRREGDIHVFPDDHIDWDAIEARLQSRTSLVRRSHYLLFKRGYCEETYMRYANKTADMQLLVFKKTS